MEPSNRIAFRWAAHEDGYSIFDDGDGMRWLVANKEKGDTRQYLPAQLEPPGALHRRFAGLYGAKTRGEFESRIVAFATEYGPLWPHQTQQSHIPKRGGVFGDTAAWEREAERMQRVIEVWETAEIGTLAEMNEILKTDAWPLRGAADSDLKRHKVTEDGGTLFHCVDWGSNEQPQVQKTRKAAAQHLRRVVAAEVGEMLRGQTEIPYEGQPAPSALVTRAPVLFEDHLELQDRPLNLLGYLWLEFAYTLDRRAKERNCAHCDETFIIDARRGTRENRLYCSERCRMAVYRGKKRDARALHVKGWTPGRIAKELCSETKTVHGWIQAAKQRRK